jgi:hypothetical protein
MLSCKQVCTLVSESIDRQLPWQKRLGIRLHLFICKGCRNMVKQIKLIHLIADRFGAVDKSTDKAADLLSDDARNRILANVQQHRHGPGTDE